MLERPDLADETIGQCLHEHYGLVAQAIIFLPIGYDATAWVFRVEAADHASYFLKVKSVPVTESSLAVPHFLRQRGVAEVVAPLPTRNQALSAPINDRFTAILYPFVEGRVGMDGGLSPAQWSRLGRILADIHASALPSSLAAAMRRERFIPLKGELAWSLHQEVSSTRYTDPIHEALATFWRKRSAEIEHILRRCTELGHLAQARRSPLVLCHADIHIFNVLVDAGGGIHIVDWDETVLAPKERDLMFLVQGAEPDGAQNEVAFRQGYGPVTPDPVILAFYRYEWVVQEIAEFGRQVLRGREGSEITRLDGLRHFRALFDPGDVVASAYAADG